MRTKLAGTCAGNFEGMLCASCPIGKTGADGECGDCGATWFGWMVVLLGYLMAVPSTYYFVNLKATWLQLTLCNCHGTGIFFERTKKLQVVFPSNLQVDMQKLCNAKDFREF